VRRRQELRAHRLRLRRLERRRPQPKAGAGHHDQGRGVPQAIREIGPEGSWAVERRERELQEIPTRHALRAGDRRDKRRDRERESQVAHALRQYLTVAPTSRKRFPLARAACRFPSFNPGLVERPCC
jgi:hypothetical protein